MASTSSKYRRRAIGEDEIRDMKSTPERERKRARTDRYANDVLREIRGPHIMIHRLNDVVRNGMTIEEGARRLTALQLLIDARLVRLNIADGSIRLLNETANETSDNAIADDVGRRIGDEFNDEDEEIEEVERRRGRDNSIENHSSNDDLVADGTTPDQAREIGSIDGRLPRVAVVLPMTPPPQPPQPEVIDADHQLILEYADNADVRVVVDEGVVIGIEMLGAGDDAEDAAQAAAAAANVETKIQCRIDGCRTAERAWLKTSDRDRHELCHALACAMLEVDYLYFFTSERNRRLEQLQVAGFIIHKEKSKKNPVGFVDDNHRVWCLLAICGPSSREIEQQVVQLNRDLDALGRRKISYVNDKSRRFSRTFTEDFMIKFLENVA